MAPITIFTIGFSRKSAAEFFPLLEKAGVRRVLDIRLNNTSQLAGFAKHPNLAFFFHRILGIEGTHSPEMAPSKEILDAYKKHRIDWQEYERQFKALLASRRIEEVFSPDLLNKSCLLCTEPQADRCHRRLVAEYLQAKWGDVKVVHL